MFIFMLLGYDARASGEAARLARSREARFACPNRRACSQATVFAANLTFFAFGIDAYSRWALIRGWALNSNKFGDKKLQF